jgi:hypothetical protein
MILDNLEKCVENVKQDFSLQIDKIYQIYLQAEKIMQEEKINHVAKLNEKMWECINMIEQLKSVSRKHELDLGKSYLDIEKNYENIIKDIENEPFKLIMSKYMQKLKGIENFIVQIKE